MGQSLKVETITVIEDVLEEWQCLERCEQPSCPICARNRVVEGRLRALLLRLREHGDLETPV
jgi:hypothetical protein